MPFVDIVQPIVAQWPTLGGLVVLGLTFWKMAENYLRENKQLLEGNKALSDQRAEEIERLRVLLERIEKERNATLENYQSLREDFSKIMMENASLKRLIEALEEMVRASGGDIKVIAKQVEANSEELKEISEALFALPPPKN